MDFIDRLFSVGTGWLGWTPDVTLNTPIPQIMLAVEGKMEFLGKTNPFGAPPKPKPKRDPKLPSIEEQRASFQMRILEARQKHQQKAKE